MVSSAIIRWCKALYLQSLRVSLISLNFFFSFEAMATWSEAYCLSSESGQYLKLEISPENGLSASSNESLYFIYRMPCNKVSIERPLVQCRSEMGADGMSFFSFYRSESGFESPYDLNESPVDKYFFIFEKGFRNPAGEYIELKREFSFLSSQCQVK